MNIDDYLRSSLENRMKYIESRSGSIPDRFVQKKIISSDTLFPIYQLEGTDLEFILIVGGEFTLGLSDENLAKILVLDATPNITVEEMQPVHERTVGDMLIMDRPYLNADRKKATEGHEEFQPFFCSFEEATSISDSFGLRLPHEEEWEYVVKANKDELFTFGDRLPGESRLEKWLSWDFSDSASVVQNRFGMSGLYFSEWCADLFKKSHLKGSEIDRSSHVIKGGGAYFWPWQDEEWVWCLSTMRMPSRDLLDGKAVFRMVYSL